MQPSPLFTKAVILRVAVPTPVRRLFDYLMPTTSTDATPFAPMAGARVSVPFGKRTLLGIIVAIAEQPSKANLKLKHVIEIFDQTPLFNPALLELFVWTSNYYQYPIGMLFAAAMPARLRKLDNGLPQVSAEGLRSNNFCTRSNTAKILILSSAQQTAVDQVSNSFGKFAPFLLNGVTGSGKTEVYLQLIEKMIALGKQTLILVPEINLTPQTLAHLQERFPTSIAVLHSQVTEKNRALAWLQAQQGSALIILGTRLAAFTPLKKPGLFIVDEEHDLSFKQQDHLRYSARDLLLKRAQLEQCPIVLGTATPALETWHNAQTGRFQHLQLPKRAGSAQKPNIEIIDIRHKKLDDGLSAPLLAEIQQQLADNNQVLLFLNRRGYAPVLMCLQCSWHHICKRCDSNMILHDQGRTIRCHHCGAQHIPPTQCLNCNAPNLTSIGLGTQRLEACLTKYFPQASIARVDKDTVHTKQQMQDVLTAVHDRTTNILIGTQMLAKGHHFPNLALVAIVDIDAALFSTDFRATERVGQLITQVAGRTGRGEKIGKVLLQTAQPENPLLQTLIQQDYEEFLLRLIKERRASNLPPYTYQVMFRAETKTPNIANSFLNMVKQLLMAQKTAVNCLGPIPAPMEKRQGFYRAQLLMQATQRKMLHSILQAVIPQIEDNKITNKVRWSIDVDPLEMY